MDKKKFLTELGKLLTFMYDEDRATALSMYLEMFEQASDEEALLRLLSSPTRQAVLLARSYHAREKDLTVRGSSGKGDADVQTEKEPPFVQTINAVSAQAEEAGLLSSYVSVWSDMPSDSFPENSADRPGSPENSGTARDGDDSGDDSSAGSSVSGEPVDEKEAAVDRLLQNFMADSPDSPDSDSNAASAPEKAAGDPTEDSSGSESGAYDRYLQSAKPPKEKKTVPHRESKEKSTEPKETNMLLLVLYILLAVPVTAVLLFLLLIPAVVALAASVLLIVLGVKVISTAFTGFSVFADIMVVLGAAFVLIALGLFAFWIFLWIVGTVMVNLINGAIVLGEHFATTGGD